MSWSDEALCIRVTEPYWFSDDKVERAIARRICAQCPAKGPCLAEALQYDAVVGIWAGTDERERRRMR